MKLLFFVHEPWEKEYIKQETDLLKHAEVTFITGALDADHVPETKGVEAISVFVDSHVDEDVLEKFSDLKFIATRSTGFDHIDIVSCKKRGITISNVPAYGEHTVAEYTFALILALSRKICEARERIRETGSFSQEGLRGFDIREKTLGVVGTGHIGKNVIRIARGFGMKVFASDMHADQAFAKETGCEYRDFPDVLKESDIVTLHVPYMKATHHVMNTKTIAEMKQGAYLINTSRGAVVDTEALVMALKSGHLGGAALDVLEEEGMLQDEAAMFEKHPAEETLRMVLADHVLIDMPNVIVTPHNAFNTWGGLRRILQTTVENAIGFVNGSPVNIVSVS